MTMSRRLVLLVIAVLATVSVAGATKYYFNSFDTGSLAGWVSNPPADGNPNAGLYKWVGGAYGYEMLGYDANLAKGMGAAVSAAPAATVAQDFWMGADFRHLGGYLPDGTGYKHAYVFFLDSTGAGLGVWASLEQTTGTAGVGMVWTDDFYSLTTAPNGVVNGVYRLGADRAFPTDWSKVRLDVNYKESEELMDVYLNGSLVWTRELLYLENPPDPSVARNFTKVGVFFYNSFDEPATYGGTTPTYACLSVDNIWMGDVASPYVNATLLAGDINGDLTVDVVDLGLLATSWKKGQATWAGSPNSFVENPGQPLWSTMPSGDFNHDGTVDVVDLGLLATNWKKSVSTPTEPTPEPATMALLGVAGLGLLARRKR